jgi:hypothetical protein
MPQSNADNKSMKVLSAAKAAEIIIDGMENNSYRVLVGSDAKFMDLISRLNPAYAAKFIYKKMKAILPD